MIKNKSTFIINWLLIVSFLILKLIDFITTLIFLEKNLINESNPFAVPLTKNALLLYSLLLLFMSFISILNIAFYKIKFFNDFLTYFLIFIILLNIQSIYVLIHNYEIFIRII